MLWATSLSTPGIAKANRARRATQSRREVMLPHPAATAKAVSERGPPEKDRGEVRPPRSARGRTLVRARRLIASVAHCYSAIRSECEESWLNSCRRSSSPCVYATSPHSPDPFHSRIGLHGLNLLHPAQKRQHGGKEEPSKIRLRNHIHGALVPVWRTQTVSPSPDPPPECSGGGACVPGRHAKCSRRRRTFATDISEGVNQDY